MAAGLDYCHYKYYQVVLQVATELKKNVEEINSEAVIMLLSEVHKLWECAATNATFYTKMSSITNPSCTEVSRTPVNGDSSFAPQRIIGPEQPCNCDSRVAHSGLFCVHQYVVDEGAFHQDSFSPRYH